jgi:hypothetical protein
MQVLGVGIGIPQSLPCIGPLRSARYSTHFAIVSVRVLARAPADNHFSHSAYLGRPVTTAWRLRGDARTSSGLNQSCLYLSQPIVGVWACSPYIAEPGIHHDQWAIYRLRVLRIGGLDPL